MASWDELVRQQEWQPQWHYDRSDKDDPEALITLRHDVFSGLLDEWDRLEWLGTYCPQSILKIWLP